MRFREQRDVQRMPACGGVVEAGLIGKDGLPGARWTLDDVDTGFEQSPVEDAVETLNAGRSATVRGLERTLSMPRSRARVANGAQRSSSTSAGAWI